MHASPRLVALAPALVLGALAGACGGDDHPPGDMLVDAPPGATGPIIGSVQILETHFPSTMGDFAQGRVTAQFYDGEGPSWHREAMRDGACVLKTFTLSTTCSACTTGLCVEGVCQAFPQLASAGRLTLGGLRTAITIDPDPPGFYSVGEPLPANLFDDDATISARAAGAAIPALSLTARGVPALSTGIANGRLSAPYPATRPLAVTWTPSGDPDARVHLTLNANNAGHGYPYAAIIECDAPDNAGQIDVPESILDAFPATDWWEVCAGSDCPPSSIRRYHRATQQVGDQAVELVVASELQFLIKHERP